MGGRIRRTRVAHWVACAGLLLGVGPKGASGDPAPKVVVGVPAEGAFVGSTFVVKGMLSGAPKGAVVKLGELSAAVAADGAFEFGLTGVREGVQRLRVVYAAPGAPEVAGLRNVTVDTTPPTIEDLVPSTESTVVVGEKAKVSGRVVDKAPVEIRVSGQEVRVDEDGKFNTLVEFAAAGSVTVTITSQDLAGNVAAPIVRRISRWVDPGPPRLNFEVARDNTVRVVWIARDFTRVVFRENPSYAAAEIRAHEGKTPGFGTLARPLTVLVRAADTIPGSRFNFAMRALQALGGSILVTAPPADPAASGGSVDSIELVPDVSKDGSWHVRFEAKDWLIPVGDVRLITAPGWNPLAPPTRRAIDEIGAQLKDVRRSPTVRFRLTEPVPVRLLDEVRLAGCSGAGVIVECSGPSGGAGAGKPSRPPPPRAAFQSRFDYRNSGKGGGGSSADVCVKDALAWLAAHQSPDGRWECEGWKNWCDRSPASQGVDLTGAGHSAFDVGVTGLALLAFLGAGYTDQSAGPYAKVVGDALAYLTRVQDREGCFGKRSTGHYVYDHAIATSAMVEAFGMTRNEKYRAPAQLGLDFIAITRNPYFAWRYGIKPGDNDTSVTTWMMLALHSANLCNLADGKTGEPPSLEYDEEALEGIKAWVDKMTDPDTGRVGYQQRGTNSSRSADVVDRFPFEKTEAMTAAGMLARMALGESPKSSEIIKKAADLCARLLPTWNPSDGSIDMCYWYFGTSAMFQVGGDPWRKWESAIKTAIFDTQRKDTEFCRYKGSWDPIDAWGDIGGRVYATAIMALSCEVWYRYR